MGHINHKQWEKASIRFHLRKAFKHVGKKTRAGRRSAAETQQSLAGIRNVHRAGHKGSEETPKT